VTTEPTTTDLEAAQASERLEHYAGSIRDVVVHARDVARVYCCGSTGWELGITG
jgi:hypothetical protein